MFNNIGRALHFIVFVFLFLVALGSSGASKAQSTFDPDEAKAFVRAALAASRVSETWQPRISRAKSEVEAERLREKAAIALRRAIRDVDGMTVDRYRKMYYAAKQNPELVAYLSDLLEQEVAEAEARRYVALY